MIWSLLFGPEEGWFAVEVRPRKEEGGGGRRRKEGGRRRKEEEGGGSRRKEEIGSTKHVFSATTKGGT